MVNGSFAFLKTAALYELGRDGAIPRVDLMLSTERVILWSRSTDVYYF